jgi:hypothetical protein
MGIAMTNLASANNGTFPPGYGAYGAIVETAGAIPATAPWSVHILPVIEQKGLYDDLVTNGSAATLTGYPVPTYVAPSDPTNDPTKNYLSSAANYKSFGYKGPNLDRDFERGTSTTVMLMERYAAPGIASPGGSPHFWHGQCLTTARVPSMAIIDPKPAMMQQKPPVASADDSLPRALTSSGMQICMADGSVRNVTLAQKSMWVLACDRTVSTPLDQSWYQ